MQFACACRKTRSYLAPIQLESTTMKEKQYSQTIKHAYIPSMRTDKVSVKLHVQ